MIDPAIILRFQNAAEAEYQKAVAETERELGVELPRFRGVKFMFASYKKPTDKGQAPFYRRFPGLSAKPYWELSDYPEDCRAVLKQFEDDYPALRDEFEAAIAGARGGFRGAETGYFGVEARWLSFELVGEDGRPLPEALAAFPKMAALIERLIELKYPCKTYFALMMPGVHLQEHCGGQNNYLRMHFALRVPKGDLGMKVGGIERGWTNGKQLFFDDTFVHEAWNRSEEDRYILLMRLLHPELSPLERKAYFLIEDRFTATEIFRQLEELKKQLGGPKD